VKQLITQFETAQQEISDSRARMNDALTKMGEPPSEVEGSLALRTTTILGVLKKLREQKDDAGKLQAELDKIKASLHEALSSVGSLTKDKRKLSDQIKDLVDEYQEVMAARDAALKDLEKARALADAARRERGAADERVRAIKEHSQRERQLLVQQALRSLHDLRTHMSHTASGVRMQQPADDDSDDDAAFVSWDHPNRWGAPARAKGDMLLISLKAPEVPPLDVTPKRVSSARPRSSRPTSSPPTQPSSPSSRHCGGSAPPSPRLRRTRQRTSNLSPLSSAARAMASPLGGFGCPPE